MKKAARAFFALALAACSPVDPEPLEAKIAAAAEYTLVHFFDALHQGDYAAADILYGGDYQTLIDWNPDIDSDDHLALWEAGCLRNGLQCLTVRSAELHSRNDDRFTFAVTFYAPDGSLFVLGPCCGADATAMPPVCAFEITVRWKGDVLFEVLDLPPYVP